MLEENLSKRNGLKHYIIIDYSRQTRDQITAQKYCANPHPNNTYCESRCSITLIRKLLNTVAQNENKVLLEKLVLGTVHMEVIVCCNHNSVLYI